MPSEVRNRFLLLYGSQTGQAKAIAEEVQEKSEQFGLHAELHCISQTEKRFNLERERCVVFVVSTTGDGEPPDTVQKFWRRLNKRTLPDTHLQHLNYSLLGLGDTNYTNFCKCGKSLDKRLEQLGAKRFFPCAWADDGVGLEVAAEPWIDNVIPAVRDCLGLPAVIVKSVELISKGDNSAVPKMEEPSVKYNTAQSSGQIAVDDKIENDNQTDLTESKKDDINMSELSQPGSNRTDTLDSANSGTQKAGVPAPETSVMGNGVGATGSDVVDHKVLGGNMPDGNIPDLENPKELSSPLTSPSPELKDFSLTVPLLPPPFLCLNFTEQTSQISELSEELPYQNGCALPSAASPVTMATVVSAKRLTREDAVKTALSLELKIDPSVIQYRPGDAISVICPNPHHEVSKLLNRLKLADVADSLFELSVMPDTKKRRAAIPDHIPAKASLRHILTTCVDIRHPPKKALLRVLLEFTSDPAQKRRLQELCSKQGGQQYTQFIHGPGLSILDLLTAFTSCSPTAVRLLEHLPRLQPRPYSVASSPLVHGDRLRIVFNVIEVTAGDGRCAPRRGVCTGWLNEITGDVQVSELASLENHLTTLTLEEKSQIQIPVFARTNQTFHMPEDLSVPLIMIGPGTGVAPFVGFLQHRECLLKERMPESVGNTWLFYGCRHKDRDFLFREELERLNQVAVLSELCVSFSRDEDSGDNHRYVQDNLRSHGPEIIDLIEKKAAVIFVCGDAKNMAKTVNDTFVDLYQSCKGMSAGDARSQVMSLRLARRYLEDVWT